MMLSLTLLPAPALATSSAEASAAVLKRVAAAIQPDDRVRPLVQVIPGSTVACSVATKRETRAFGVRNASMVACGASSGEVRGAVVNAQGRVRCTVAGQIDFSTDCGVLLVCGIAYPACF